MADTHTIPKPDADATPAKPATAAAMDLIGDPGHLDGNAPRQLSPGDADELIARMADAQIDELLAADEDGAPPPPAAATPKPAPLPQPTPATTPVEVVAPVKDALDDPLGAIDALLAADETPAPPAAAPKAAAPAAEAPDPLGAIDALLAAADTPAPAAAAPASPPAADASDPLSALDALLAADEIPATPAKPAAAPAPPPAADASDPLGALDALLAADEIPTTPAKPTEFPPSFSPPQSKRPQVNGTPTPDDAAIEPASKPGELAALLAANAPAAAAPAHDLQSSADAVAAELAADVKRSPPRVAPSSTPAPDDHRAAQADDAEPHGLRAVPGAALDLINYPVSGLSDQAREALGAIAVVTLANATALLIYLVLFRP